MRDDRTGEIENRYAGYQVYDNHYEKIGKVDDLFVDEQDSPEYIGVQMGGLGARSTLIPMQAIRANDKRQLVEVAADREMIENAPTFEIDEEITLDFEDRVCAYFGVERDAPQERSGYGSYYSGPPSTEDRPDVDLEYGERSDTYEPRIPASETPASPEWEETPASPEREDAPVSRERGETPVSREQEEAPASREREAPVSGEHPADERPEIPEPGAAGEPASGRVPDPAPEEELRSREPGVDPRAARTPDEPEDSGDELRVQRTEEELHAGTREREAGSVNVRKRVRTEREQVRVPKRREEVKVDRVPVSEEPAEIGEEEIRVPITEEEIVVEKRPEVKEEIRIRKEVVEDEEVVEEDVRKEEVDVEDHSRRNRE